MASRWKDTGLEDLPATRTVRDWPVMVVVVSRGLVVCVCAVMAGDASAGYAGFVICAMLWVASIFDSYWGVAVGVR